LRLDDGGNGERSCKKEKKDRGKPDPVNRRQKRKIERRRHGSGVGDYEKELVDTINFLKTRQEKDLTWAPSGAMRHKGKAEGGRFSKGNGRGAIGEKLRR